jgi:para-aminobenzoate synthetase/4-amino-4-deoxychorismate lyase
VYDAARTAHPDVDDVVLWNERGEVTETCIANIAAQLDGRWLTPLIGCGLLAGAYRAQLVEEGKLAECRIPLEMLRSAKAVAVFNSVRGWRNAQLPA